MSIYMYTLFQNGTYSINLCYCNFELNSQRIEMGVYGQILMKRFLSIPLINFEVGDHERFSNGGTEVEQMVHKDGKVTML